MFKKTCKLFVFCLIILILNSGTNFLRAEEVENIKKFKKGDKFVIALIPEKNVFEQRERYKYITKYLSEKLNLNVKAEVLSSYGEICDAFLENRADAGFFGSFSYVLTNAKANIEPIARPVWLDGSSTYSGYIFARKDSGIEKVADMEGKILALVSRATTAGYIFQVDYFLKHGVDNMESYFSKIYFAGSHDASAWSVYIGEADVGGGKNHIFNALKEEDPDFRNQMVVLAKSLEVPSNGLAVRGNMDPSLKKKIRSLLLNLDKTQEGQKVLKEFGAAKFIATTDEDYSSLYGMIKRLGIDLQNYPYKD